MYNIYITERIFARLMIAIPLGGNDTNITKISRYTKFSLENTTSFHGKQTAFRIKHSKTTNVFMVHTKTLAEHQPGKSGFTNVHVLADMLCNALDTCMYYFEKAKATASLMWGLRLR